MLPYQPNAPSLQVAGRYQFISIRAPDDAKDPTTRRLARSHAVKQALESKRKLQQQSGDNFRTMIPKDETRRSGRQKKHTRTLAESPFSLSTGALDPFHTLPVDSSRLQALLGDYKARQAPEPVFSVAKELAFQNFHSVFRTGLVDPALLNTIMLSLVLAVAGGSMNQEGLEYQGQAISHIRRNMSSLNEATSESTIGAILLLAGVESHISSRLLWELQHANENPIWDDHPELLLWLLYIGGAFAPIGTVRSDYLALLRSNNAARFRDLCRSWPELLGILKQFTWSDKAFTSQAKAFWEESLA
ncbi:hypothetical protein MMC34_003163 [Xylographa carneopallida]|nr:hypothetical protein [Xylographa carneopallida]